MNYYVRRIAVCVFGCRSSRLAAGLMLGGVVSSATLRGQDRQPSGDYTIAAHGTAAELARGESVLEREGAITLDLDNVSLKHAVRAIEASSPLRVFYSDEVASFDLRVTVHVKNVEPLEALRRALAPTPVMAVVIAPHRVALERRGRPSRQQAGVISGRVTDAKTGQPLPDAAIVVDATGARATTKNDGQYAIADALPGTYIITGRLLGHAPQSKQVLVKADSVTRVDFALAEAVAALEQVVTTAVGDQRKVELGNSIATIDADSLVRTAPVTSVTDVLSGRAPGLQVLEQQGQVGAGPRIRIRGLSSFTLSNDPIIYVDGMRVDNTPGSFNGASPVAGVTGPTPSRLNDIDPGDIASIDVLKGPSAATEYGTDAANGVIVIKTKHGHAGAPQLHVHAEQGISNVPGAARFEVPWMSWGHTTDGSHMPVTCPRTLGHDGPTISNGGCVLDSVTTYQPLDHTSTTVFGIGNQFRAGADLSGGTEQIQYFLSGATDNATGVLQLPRFFHQQLAAHGRPIPGYEQRPNTMDGSNVRGRAAAGVGNTADIEFSTAYTANQQRSANDLLPIQGSVVGPGYRDPLYGGYDGTGFLIPSSAFALAASQGIHRFAGATNAAWRPSAWLSTHAAVGLDRGERTDDSFQAPGPDPNGFTAFSGNTGTGYHAIGHVSTSLYTMDLGATATASLSSFLSSKTSAGLQYSIRNQVGTLAQAYGLAANGSLNGASVYISSQIDSEAKTVGSYIEERLGWRDRLFLTGAVRVDAGSGFGSRINSAVYPKLGFSWATVEAPSYRLRLRAAYGESGVQPPNGATLSLYAPALVGGGGISTTGDTGVTAANPRLKPERSSELEAGFDAGVLGDRVTLEITYYRKQTRNTIVSNVLPGSNGGRIEYDNLGSVLNYGVEGSLSIQVLETRPVSWDVTLGGAVNQNRLLSLAPGQPPINAPFFPFFVQYRQVVGYPLFGFWAPRLQYADANHDGIIEPSEVSETGTNIFVGSSTPAREVTLNSGVSVFNYQLRIAAQVDYRGGFKIQNGLRSFAEEVPSGAVLNDPHASLADQARAVEQSHVIAPLTNAYFDDGTFVRWRELAVTYFLADRFTRALHMHASSVTFLGRNLALWTRYTGADPEVMNVGSAFVGGPPDGVFDLGGTPQVRSWAVRVNLAL